MTEADKPLTAYALKVLRRLAEGNGVDPGSIHVAETDEKDVGITGILYLTPKAEAATARHSGRFRSFPKDAQSFGNFAELSNFVTQEQQKYGKSENWFKDIKTDLESQPGKGWGLDDVRFTHDTKPNITATALELCPSCGGQASITCDLCGGRSTTPCPACNQRGQEQCYNCFGVGTMPNDPEQVCQVCNGTRFALCRTCRGSGGIACGKCKGTGMLSCPPCEGTGKIMEVATISFGVDASFAIGSGIELPAALRRALDRHGFKFLTKGHADIDYVKDEDEQKPGLTTLQYTAKMPAAEMVMGFGKERKRVAIFGKRRMLLDVPPFLDKGLEPGIAVLEAIGKSGGDLNRVLKFRALRDACHLALTGLGSSKNLRKKYPYGLSPAAADRIMRLMVKALRRMTVMARYAAVALTILVAGAMGIALYFTPVHERLGAAMGLAAEIVLPAACAMLGYIAVEKAAGLIFRRKFPDIPAARRQGGYLAILAATSGLLVPFAVALLHPEAAFWLRHFVGAAK